MGLAQVFETFPELETGRLRLRQFRPGDAPALYTVLSDDQTTQFLDVASLTAPEQAEAMIERLLQRYRQATSIRWVITLKGEDRLIGSCGYPGLQPGWRSGELGYELGRAHWRRGIMFEALTAVIRFGFWEMALNRIQARVVVDNIPSERLLARLRFRREGVTRQAGYWKGAYHDLIVYALLRDEFKDHG